MKRFCLLTILTLQLIGCSNLQHFQYPAQELSAVQERINKNDLKIAVMSFEDARPNKHTGNIQLANIPLVPTWGETISRNQSYSLACHDTSLQQ